MSIANDQQRVSWLERDLRAARAEIGRHSFVIFDLDGCLCDCSARVPLLPDYEAFHSRCREDPPRHAEITVAKAMLAFSGHIKLLINTGRTEAWRADTNHWLAGQGIGNYDLAMRPQHDSRPSSVLKAEVVERYRKAGARILFAVDDRVNVVVMYQQLGIPVFQSHKLFVEGQII
jgi:hypothetical protein